MFFRRGQDEVIKRVEERIAAFSMVPAGAHALRPLVAAALTLSIRRPR
jgi:hypothetical protein